MEYMKDCEDNAFDLAIVDPPYTNKFRDMHLVQTGNVTNSTSFTYAGLNAAKPDAGYFSEIFRVSRQQIIFGCQYFIEFLPETNCLIVWDKDNAGNYADAEIAWTSFKTATRIYKFKWHGMLQGDMKNKEHRIHPTQKPVKLYDWLLTNYAKPGQRILDTHLGSGSSAIAAHYFGVDFVGCELDEDYYNAAIERIDQSTRQQDLFADK